MLSDPIRELVQKIEAVEEVQAARPPGEQLFELNRILSKAAGFYEKVRYLIDYREEHTIRRAALERILKRRVFIEQRAESGSVLLQELVDGKYISKEEATEEAAKEIDVIIANFLDLWHARREGIGTGRKLISFAATEIDSLLSPLQYAIDHASAEALYHTLHGHVSASGFTEEDVNAQLYCACWRALLAADHDRLSYALWLLYMPEWKTGNLQAVAAKLPATIAQIQRVVQDQLQWQIAPKIKNESIYFRIIREVLIEKGAGGGRVLESSRELDQFTSEFLEKKYEKENERIQSSGIRAVVYLFITKMTIAIVAEVPYEIFVLGAINYLALTINVLFHPMLLFALTRRVGSLDESNTKAIIEGIHRILYEGRVRTVRIGGTFTRFSLAFGFAYLLLMFIVFGAIIGILELFAFNPVSIVLFMFFLALVSYFAFRIRYQARRWKVVEDQGTSAVIAGVLAVPVIRTGRWLSQTFSSINVFVLILDFIIETPFKRLLSFSNQFMFYLREKAEEMR